MNLLLDDHPRQRLRTWKVSVSSVLLLVSTLGVPACSHSGPSGTDKSLDAVCLTNQAIDAEFPDQVSSIDLAKTLGANMASLTPTQKAEVHKVDATQSCDALGGRGLLHLSQTDITLADMCEVWSESSVGQQADPPISLIDYLRSNYTQYSKLSQAQLAKVQKANDPSTNCDALLPISGVAPSRTIAPVPESSTSTTPTAPPITATPTTRCFQYYEASTTTCLDANGLIVTP